MRALTIGLPVYNGSAFIAGAIESLLAQTHRDFELLISDNASTDDTEAICRRFSADPRVRYYRHAQNQGPFPNFAYVLYAAKSPYFMWAAADDRWKPRFAERCVNVLEARPDVGLACGRWVIRSRKLPLLEMRRFDDLSIVDDGDVHRRVAQFIAADAGTSHKANFIYGVWRRELAIEAWEAVADYTSRGSAFGLDIALLVFALGRMRFHQVDERLFVKTSKYFPSGSWLDRLMARTVRAEKPPVEGFRLHAEMLRSSVRKAAVDAPVVERAIETWLERELRKIAARG